MSNHAQFFYGPFLDVSRIFTIFVPNYKKAKYNSAMIKDFGYCQQMSVFRYNKE